MAVATETARVSYNGNGSTNSFAITFSVTTDLSGNAKNIAAAVVDDIGAETTLTPTTDFTVSGSNVVLATGVGSYLGGLAGGASALPSGYRITLYRSVPLTQGFDFVENQTFPAEDFEDALDTLTYQNQQQQEIIDRSIKLPVTDEGMTVVLPPAASRANKIFGFDGSGAIAAIETVFQETIEGVSSEDLGGGLTRVTFTFTSGATGSFTVPSAGGATAPVANLFLTNQVISEDITVPSDKNAFTVGPVSVGAGFTVEVESGATMVVFNQPGGL